MKTLIPLFVLYVAVAAAAHAGDKDEIMAVDQAFSDMAAQVGTRAAFAHYLAADAVKLDGGAHPRYGHSAILPTLGDLSSNVSLTWMPRDGKIAASNDLAFTWGTYVLRRLAGDETELSHGKYTTIWEKRDGVWKAILDMGNPSPGPYETN